MQDYKMMQPFPMYTNKPALENSKSNTWSPEIWYCANHFIVDDYIFKIIEDGNCRALEFWRKWINI